MSADPASQDVPGSALPALATVELLRLSKLGDPRARQQLLARYLPRLRRWAAGRLPVFARSLFDTEDLVQETLTRVLQGLDRIEVGRTGGFQVYVRQAVRNRIRDEVSWAIRRQGRDEVLEDLVDHAPSPLANAIGADILDRYERALAQLDEADQEILHLRIELDFEHGEIAAMTGRPSPDAARMAFQRSLARLAELMDHAR